MTIMQWVLMIVAGTYFGFGALIGLVAGLMNAWVSRNETQMSAYGSGYYDLTRGERWRPHWPRGAPRE